MSPSPRLAPGLRQRLTLAPRLSESLRLLALSAMELTPELDAQLAANPLLEIEEPRESTEILGEDGGTDVQEESWTTLDWANASAMVDEDDALPEPAATEDLHGTLVQQLACESMSDRDRAIALVIVDVLDEDGYLRVDNAALGEALGELEPPIGEAEIEAVIHRVQTLEPSGVGARTLAECLLLQLRDRPDSSARQLAMRLVKECLDMLPRADITQLALRLECAPAALDDVLRLLRGLDPHPGFQLDHTPVQYLVPELLAIATPEGWRVELNPMTTPRVTVNENYAAWLSARRDGEGSHALATQLAEARWLVRSLAQREETLLKVGRSLVARQPGFVRAGPAYLTPMTLRDVAQELELHESTVSRAVQGKSLAAPRGVMALRSFFSVALPTSTGASASAAAVQMQIKQLIESESPQRPLSDAALVEALAQRGIRIARRTVVKYRQAAGLANAHQRRQLARPSPLLGRKGASDAKHDYGSPPGSDASLEKLR